jgi:hypothetical protein
VGTGNHELTSDALHKAANRVARAILEKNAPLLVAILAILKARKFHIPPRRGT